MFGTGNGLAALGGFMTLFLILLGILWLLVPFAIFGIKPLLRQLITEQKRTNEVLTRISQQIHPIAQAIVDGTRVAPLPTPEQPDPPKDLRTLGEIIREARSP